MNKHCKPCEGEVEKLGLEEAKALLAQVPQWQLDGEGTLLTRRFAFKDFAQALAFANEVGRVAQEEWHHPDLKVGWGEVVVSFTTHSIRGLSENDFIMAARVDGLI